MSVAQKREADAAERFAKDVADHRLTVLLDNGVYRHLRFANPKCSEYWFGLVTWPGHLTIYGDMGTYTFARIHDMLQFFNVRGGGINPMYWAEKLQGVRVEGVREFSKDVVHEHLREYFHDWVNTEDPHVSEAKEARDAIDDAARAGDEHEAREALHEIEQDSPGGFSVSDTWEWDLTDFTYHYLWCCHAVVWGIRQYRDDQAAKQARKRSTRRSRWHGRARAAGRAA